MSQSPTPTLDTVSQHIANQCQMRGSTPVPLTATSYDISIHGGLADVVASRTFRNSEESSIEATLTFPLPVDAVLYALEARIGGRLVKAVAKAKPMARESYEDALDRGKTAVLHEELLKGVHMLSVGHVAPGTEIQAVARFAMPLSSMEGRALLTIPTTVGGIYGASGLADSDELIHGGPVLMGDVTVTADSGTAILLGHSANGGAQRVALNAPIRIEVLNWSARDVVGVSADGRRVSLSITPLAFSQSALNAAILVDHSGSMNDTCAAGSGFTKHAAAVLGLSEAADDFRDGDALHLWEFDTTISDLGVTDGAGWRAALRKLSEPSGGTEIGAALATVLTGSQSRDVILITDGKSYALDVQTLAQSGRRFTVVLIGEDSLEANAGHLAALSGGQIFVAGDANVTAAVRCALRSVRCGSDGVRPLTTAPREYWQGSCEGSDPAACTAVRAGMAIRACWSTEADATALSNCSRAVAAYAAHIKLATLVQDDATRLAEAEGLVTHLTSLILVDEEGVSQTGLAATRKVALPSPATATGVRACYAVARVAPVGDTFVVSGGAPNGPASRPVIARRFAKSAVKTTLSTLGNDVAERSLASLKRKRERAQSQPLGDRRPAQMQVAKPLTSMARSAGPNAREIANTIPWRTHAVRLARGHIDELDQFAVVYIRDASAMAVIQDCAKRLGLTPERLVIAVLARAASSTNRFAARVARAILGRVAPALALYAEDILGLSELKAVAVGS